MKISHESPISLLNHSRSYNDYDYALVHLFDTDETYLKFFVDSLKQGRHVILDNSIFELGEAYDHEKFLYWVDYLKPTEYIIPDVLEDSIGTMNNAQEWKEKYWGKTPKSSKCIGVVQGKTYYEIVQCYKYLDKHIGVDKLAFSFDYSYYREIAPHPNKWMSFALGRIDLMNRLMNDGVINTSKPHHLLGCALPIEFMFYRQGFEWLETLDTSNPVVHGLLGIEYEPGGLTKKESIKLVDLLYRNTDQTDVDKIEHNVKIFRKIVNG
jgi:hypothetical protein